MSKTDISKPKTLYTFTTLPRIKTYKEALIVSELKTNMFKEF